MSSYCPLQMITKIKRLPESIEGVISQEDIKHSARIFQFFNMLRPEWPVLKIICGLECSLHLINIF